MYDKFQQVAFDSQIAAAILGDATAREFVLVDLEPGPIPPNLYGRGLGFIGVVGIVDGAPLTELAVELDSAAIAALAMALIRHLAGIIVARLQPVSDSIAWCERLYKLEDSRRDYTA